MGKDSAKREAIITATILLLAVSFISLAQDYDFTGYGVFEQIRETFHVKEDSSGKDGNERIENFAQSLSPVSPVDLSGTFAPLATKLTGDNTVTFDPVEQKYIFTYREGGNLLTQYEIDLDTPMEAFTPKVQDGVINIYEKISNTYPVVEGGLSYRKQNGGGLNPRGLKGLASAGRVFTHELNNDIVSFRIDEAAEGTPLVKRYDFEIRGKTLIIHTHNDGQPQTNHFGNYQGFTFNNNTGLINPKNLSVSYAETAPLIVTGPANNRHFITTYIEWTKSNHNIGSGPTQFAAGNSHFKSYSTKYHGDSSITSAYSSDFMPPIDETVYVTVSNDPDEALPTLHRSPSQYRADISKRLWYELWVIQGSGSQEPLEGLVPGVMTTNQQPFDKISFIQDYLKSLGMDDLYVSVNRWYTLTAGPGCVSLRPQLYPPYTNYGGKQKLRTARDNAVGHGYLFSLYQGYVSMFYKPSSPYWNSSRLNLNRFGSPFNSEPIPSCSIIPTLGIQDPAHISPDHWLYYVRDIPTSITGGPLPGESPSINADIDPTATYLDVHPKAMWYNNIDYQPSANTKTMADIHQRIVDLITYQKSVYDGPLYGEGGPSERIQSDTIHGGLVDGFYGEAAKKNQVPVIPNVELKQVKPVMIRGGMGWWDRWVNSATGINFDTYDFDHYDATAVAFGHAGLFGDPIFMTDQEWNSGVLSRRQAVFEKLLKVYVNNYYMYRDLQEQYLDANVVDILYHNNGEFRNFRDAADIWDQSYFNNPKLKITYDNGLEIHVNRQQSGLWTVNAADGKTYYLPKNSWVAVNPSLGFTEFSALADSNGNPSPTGNRINYVESENYLFINPRGNTIDLPNKLNGCVNLPPTSILKVVKTNGLQVEERSNTWYERTYPYTPCVSQISPNSAKANQKVTIKGSFFEPNMKVFLEGQQMQLITEKSAKLVFRIPQNWKKYGNKQVVVQNAQGQTLNTFSIQIQQSLPQPGGEGLSLPKINPTITSISPATLQNFQKNTLELRGSNFFPGATVFLNGVVADVQNPVVENANLMFLSLPAGFSEGQYFLSLQNPGVEGQSNGVSFIVQQVAAAAIVNTLAPNQVVNTASNQITLTGTGFVPGSSVLFNGGSPPSGFTLQSITPTQVIFNIGQGFPISTAPQHYQVSVRNPNPPFMESNALQLEVYSQSPASFTYLSPTSIQQGSNEWIYINWNTVNSGAIMLFNGVNHGITTSPFHPLRRFQAPQVPSGTYQLSIQNPGAPPSNTMTFTIT